MRIVIAGGGTGGHLFPGIAVAEEIRARSPGTEVVFVGTARGIETRLVPPLGYPLELVEAAPFVGGGLRGALRALLALPRSILQAARVLRRVRASLVLGVGGYASVPAGIAARLLGIPLAVQEQNLTPGLANRLLGRLARRVFVPAGTPPGAFPEGKTVVTGNPVRRRIVEAARGDAARVPGGETVLSILVLGGSQGARSINRALVEALPLLERDRPRLRVVHQTGAADRAWVAEAYARLGWEAHVAAFLDDMGPALARADWVVARAGATTIAELTVSGRGSLLVPYPHAGAHQEVNARGIAEAGGAIVLADRDLSGERIAREIRGLLEDRPRVAEMGRRARALGRPEAAADAAEACLALARSAP